MIEVSTKHQLLHEVPCFFFVKLGVVEGNHHPVRLVTGPLMGIPSDGRFAQIWHLREIQKKCVPMKLAFSLGGYPAW